jgi:hypothetical protein
VSFIIYSAINLFIIVQIKWTCAILIETIGMNNYVKYIGIYSGSFLAATAGKILITAVALGVVIVLVSDASSSFSNKKDAENYIKNCQRINEIPKREDLAAIYQRRSTLFTSFINQ